MEKAMETEEAKLSTMATTDKRMAVTRRAQEYCLHFYTALLRDRPHL